MTTTETNDNRKVHLDKILDHLVKHFGNIKNTISETVPGSRISVNIHIYDGWLEEGVVLPNGEHPQSFTPNTKLSSILVCRPQETGLENLNTKQGNVHFYSLVPIYEEERSFALEKGHEFLLGKSREKGSQMYWILVE